MAQVHAASRTKERPVVLGVRVNEDLRAAIKIEAARRGVTIAELFEEMWRTYREQKHVRGS